MSDADKIAGRLSDFLGPVPSKSEVPTDQDAEEREVEEEEVESEEIESEDVESEDVEEEVEEDSDAEEGEDDEEPTVTVTIDGKAVDVTLDELKAGYQRQADYTHKTEAVAAARKEIEAEKARLREAENDRLQKLDDIISVFDDDPKPKLTQFDGDTDEYLEALSAWEDRNDYRDTVKAERDKILQERNREAEEHFKAWAAEQERELAQMPEIAENKDTALKGLRSFMVEVIGFKEDEVANVLDARAIKAALMAKKWHDLQTKKPAAKKKVTKAPKRAKPGAAPARRDGESENYKKMRARVRKSGHVNDAAALFAGFLSDDT